MASVGWSEPLYPSATMAIAGMVLRSKSAPALEGAANPKHVPWVTGVGKGTFPFPEHGGCSAASSPALGSLCSLPERSRGKETAGECKE